MTRLLPLIGALIAIVAACSQANTEPSNTAPNSSSGQDSVPPRPALDEAKAEIGAELYLAYCAACHMPDLSGEPDWRIAREDGSFPAPPHDSSGHTWHHAESDLIDIILEGVDYEASRMPAFADRLDEQDVLAILEYLKTNWGAEELDWYWQVTWQDAGSSG